VARSLESRWEDRLVALADADKALGAAQAAAPPLPSRDELEALTADVSALWQAPTTSARDRKRLLRTLVADVTVRPEPDLGQAHLGIRWHTGATDELVVGRGQNVTEYRRTDQAVVDFVRLHGATHTNDELAAMLNEAGYFTGAGRPFDRIALVNLRSYHHIAPVGVLANGETTVADVARRTGVSGSAVYGWVKNGWLAARRGPRGRICVPFDADIERACRQRTAMSGHIAHRGAQEVPDGTERSVNQVAEALGITTHVVYYWLETGQVPARKRVGGRWLIDFTADTEAACRARVASSVHLEPTGDGLSRRSGRSIST
jgi:transposase-like protein